MQHEHLDVLILGAGLSGVGAACHLKRDCPGKRFAIVGGYALSEPTKNPQIGGTRANIDGLGAQGDSADLQRELEYERRYCRP